MADRLSWWVIPGALLILLRVATWTDAGTGPANPGAGAGTEPGTVVVREASGRRLRAVPVADWTAGAFVVALPKACAGQVATMTLWRRVDGARERSPWLSLQPTVRADSTIPIAGLAAGCYDVVVSFGTGPARQTFAANGAQVPGDLALTEPAPAR